MQYLPTSLLYSIWSILGCILNVFTMNKTIGKNIFENKSELFFNLVVLIYNKNKKYFNFQTPRRVECRFLC